ncbi:Clavaminate synthase-like protein [Trichodelitschia bisporula]|uniref:Clavaminate synthase-like protein n=1 Tax=Trichodelitschia bisporula TaxID=703511 RepID=A0A6G1I793_9PEZI|nr:Clavaminate synthase-like protein [Trichodelitschia bisporula]
MGYLKGEAPERTGDSDSGHSTSPLLWTRDIVTSAREASAEGASPNHRNDDSHGTAKDNSERSSTITSTPASPSPSLAPTAPISLPSPFPSPASTAMTTPPPTAPPAGPPTDIPSTRSTLIFLLTKALSTPRPPSDPLLSLSPATLTLLKRDPESASKAAYSQLYAASWRKVNPCWLRLYTDAACHVALALLRAHPLDYIDPTNTDPTTYGRDVLTRVIHALDRVAVMTAALGRETLIAAVMATLRNALPHLPFPAPYTAPDHFPTSTLPAPQARRPIPRLLDPDLPTFQSYLTRSAAAHPATGASPVLIPHALTHWPALHRWRNPQYWLALTLGGRRLVPVELGRSYVDDGWGQTVVEFGAFLARALRDAGWEGMDGKEEGKGVGSGALDDARTPYLAQHDLLRQIEPLRDDVLIPDACFASVPGPRGAEAEAKDDDGDEDGEAPLPTLNTWLGPPGTISPLHFDPHHNILAQVVGSKYLRLYPPSAGKALYPRTKGVGGVDVDVDMSNTGSVDVGEVMWAVEGRRVVWWEPLGEEGDGEEGEEGEDGDEDEQARARRRFKQKFPLYEDDTPYIEGVLREGECLFIPRGWWHYVVALGASCSVSYWWD